MLTQETYAVEFIKIDLVLLEIQRKNWTRVHTVQNVLDCKTVWRLSENCADCWTFEQTLRETICSTEWSVVVVVVSV